MRVCCVVCLCIYKFILGLRMVNPNSDFRLALFFSPLPRRHRSMDNPSASIFSNVYGSRMMKNTTKKHLLCRCANSVRACVSVVRARVCMCAFLCMHVLRRVSQLGFYLLRLGIANRLS